MQSVEEERDPGPEAKSGSTVVEEGLTIIGILPPRLVVAVLVTGVVEGIVPTGIEEAVNVPSGLKVVVILPPPLSMLTVMSPA